MMPDNDIRWQQRFQNFEKSFGYLQQAMHVPDKDIIQKAGMIQFFEMTFELALKMVKDFLEYQGFADVQFPRAALKKSFETGLIANGHAWLQMLEGRSLTAHTYDEKVVAEVESLIYEKYYPQGKRIII